MRRALALAFGLAAGMAGAAPETSPRPLARPGMVAPEPSSEPVEAAVPKPPVEPEEAAAPVAAAEPVVPVAPDMAAAEAVPVPAPAVEGTGPARSPIPRPRPGLRESGPPAPVVTLVAAGTGVTRSPRPVARPENLKLRAVAVAMVPVPPPEVPEARGSKKGSVCGVASIKGAKLQAIPGKVKGCGVAEPVRVTSVQGVALSTPATVDCVTAKALDAWVAETVIPAVGRLGGGVARLEVAASYACRPRNNQKGARVSEHGKGHAIDISGITLKNGITMTVLKGWRDAVQGPILRKLHARACGRFGTVLGPGSDGYHADHIHLDTARYRSGPYCR